MRILLFAQARDAVGCSEVMLPVGEVDCDGLWQKLLEAYPNLESCRDSVRLARNCEYASPDDIFRDTDEAALIPPVSGG